MLKKVAPSSVKGLTFYKIFGVIGNPLSDLLQGGVRGYWQPSDKFVKRCVRRLHGKPLSVREAVPIG
jgi:hypothetical protein